MRIYETACPLHACAFANYILVRIVVFGTKAKEPQALQVDSGMEYGYEQGVKKQRRPRQSTVERTNFLRTSAWREL